MIFKILRKLGVKGRCDHSKAWAITELEGGNTVVVQGCRKCEGLWVDPDEPFGPDDLKIIGWREMDANDPIQPVRFVFNNGCENDG